MKKGILMTALGALGAVCGLVAIAISIPVLLADANAGERCSRYNPCPVVPDAIYQGGGVEVTTVRATACFTEDILRRGAGTVRLNGTYEYTVALVYNPSRGSHEVVRTEYNQPCWTQNVAVGTYMAVYVTCRFYHGWVAVQITGPGTYTMQRVSWRFQERL